MTLKLTKKYSDTKWEEFKTKNKLGTYEINKISLLCFDDRRFVLDDGIHTLAYFHKDVKKMGSHRCNKWDEILTNNKDSKRFL